MIGRTLSQYEVIEKLGAGGMGEVYCAKDTKLGRDVALKILPASFTNDPERVARFRREAQVLASLNHPHIAQIHGLEEVNGTQFLVLELIDGETLADRIAKGPLPVDEALTIAKQIAEALEAAHERGIVHRDLKPANIALTQDGHVKVLDFGLAKATEASGSSFDLANSPTIASPAMMTGVGTILGTAAYMSPEQAKGRVADKRSDVWAFGCVLYEMLTGKRLFDGEEVSDTLAAILRGEPDWTLIPSDMPRFASILLRHCLEKNRAMRLPDMAAARFVLTEGATWDAPAAPVPAARASRLSHASPWIVAATTTAALGVGLVLWAPGKPAAPFGLVRLTAELGVDVSLGGADTAGGDLAISPDGQRVVFAAHGNPRRESQLYIRSLARLQATPLGGTDGARYPFFSPDGQWVAFFAKGKLKKVSTTGGAVVTLADASSDCCGGTWADDGTIAFVPGLQKNIVRVSSDGAQVQTLLTFNHGEVTQRWPQFLRGGRAVLYTSHNNIVGFDNATIVVQPLPTGERQVVHRGGYYGRYLPSGHVVFIQDGTLFAIPFDVDRLQLTGQPVPVIEGVTANASTGAAQFALSDTVTLVFVRGEGVSSAAPIDWMSRRGATTPLRATPATWSNPTFAPDGSRLAFDIYDGERRDVWVYDWMRDMLSRLTTDPAAALRPVWTPDGRRIAFASTRDASGAATFNLYWQKADGTGDAQRLTHSANGQFATSWHPSGKFLAFHELNAKGNYDVMILAVDGDEASGWKPRTPTTFLSSAFNEYEPMFSIDGHWLAYYSDESGRLEVYVRPFPGPGGKWQISTDGGTTPTWSPVRPELLYSTLDQRIMVAPFAVVDGTFRAEKPRLWSETPYWKRGDVPIRNFNLHPDGERLALARLPDDGPFIKSDRMTLVFNFVDELHRLARATKR
jgi:serine/threonine-protein kinase